MLTSTFEELGYGVTCIDTLYHRPGLAACYLVKEGDQAAIIDTGTAHSIPVIMEVMAQLGVEAEQVRYIMPTHVHLDHAGGAGHLMELCPKARLVVHPFGSRHLIDPSKLISGATMVYGEKRFKKDFGELMPVPAARVMEAPDGFTVELNGRPLVCLDTPGHARHHMCIYDERSGGLFTGDTFGIAYKEFDSGQGPFITPPSTPVQFDPAAWHETMRRLMSYQPERIFLAHFGMVQNPARLAAEMHRALDVYVRIANESDPSDRYQALHRGLRDWCHRELKMRGCTLSADRIDSLLALDLDLNSQGLEVWLRRKDKH